MQLLLASGHTPETAAAELARLPAPPAEDEVELDEDDDGASAGLFLAMGTQWRWAETVRVGLDYTSIASTAAAIGVTVDAQRFLDLREMEAVALDAMAKAS